MSPSLPQEGPREEERGNERRESELGTVERHQVAVFHSERAMGRLRGGSRGQKNKEVAKQGHLGGRTDRRRLAETQRQRQARRETDKKRETEGQVDKHREPEKARWGEEKERSKSRHAGLWDF